MKKTNILLQKGFTLIELLIVIAILGVLASVVLVSINPLQQLARGRDSGRISSVAQLGHAMQSYYTVQQSLPAEGATWQTTLVTAGEVANVLAAPTNSACAPAGQAQSNYCYELVSAANGQFLIWTNVEAASSIDVAAGPAAGATTCAAGTVGAAVFDSTQGRSGLACVNNTTGPTTGLTLY